MAAGAPESHQQLADWDAVGETSQYALLDAALDCVILMDELGRVTYFNESARRTFCYDAAEVLGKDLADVIIPPPQRAAHRRGLARYLDTGEANILGHRVELVAMRADESEFPVELTVTRSGASAAPGFIGFVRDITERVKSAEELRSARDRLEAIANEQASLHRVATMVARQATPDELFAVVAEEVADQLGVPFTAIIRFDRADRATIVGNFGAAFPFGVGTSWPLEETVVAGMIWQTQEPASVDLTNAGGRVAAGLLGHGLRRATGVPITVEGRLWGAMLALQSDRDTPPATVISRLQNFTELVATAVANATSRAELIAAQRRVIEAADAARERLTRDIHDGVQQLVVNSFINLQRAREECPADPARAREHLDLATEQAESGIEMLRELAAGIHPTILSDIGLDAALEALATRASIPVSLEIETPELQPSLQVSAYFFCSEAVTNVVKHSRASSASVRLDVADGQLRIEVHDDGVGGAEIGSGGSGLIGLSDRIGALEGSISLRSPRGGRGTTLTALIPLPARPGRSAL